MPAINPAGQHRRETRTAIAQWLTACRIRGVDHVYPSVPPEYKFELWRTGTVDYSCLVGVQISMDSEDYTANVGPGQPGGNLVHYNVKLHLRHRSFTPGEQDWSDDEDDYDRIVDGIKDGLRRARDLNRPDVFLTAGVWPRVRSIVAQHDDPYMTEDGPVDRWGVISFNVGQYLG